MVAIHEAPGPEETIPPEIQAWVPEIWNATTLSIAIGVLLALLVPLVLRESAAKRHIEPARTIAIWICVASGAFVIAGITASMTSDLLIVLLAAALALMPVVGFQVGRGYERRNTARTTIHFEELTLVYIQELETQNKNKAILEFREALTRILHLRGRHDIRMKMGMIALHAAQRSGSVLAEVSILIDDLGWSSIELQQYSSGEQYLSRALKILDEYVAPNDRAQLNAKILRSKLHRHLSAIKAQDNMNDAQSNLSLARAAIADEEFEERATLDAGIDVGSAYLWATHIETKYGRQARIPEENPIFQQLVRARLAVESGCKVYEEANDYERAAKSAAIELRIAQHLGEERLVQGAIGRIDRYKLLAARTLDGWIG